MNEAENMMKEKSALLMLSGGRDSFLCACRLIEAGYIVCMITYDNGHISHAEYAKDVADRIISLFGEGKASFAGVHPIAQNIRCLMQKTLYMEPVMLCQEYPHLISSQVNCLACHTTMYLHSIAYCKAHNIKTLSEGARRKQNFFIELPEMKLRYEALCKEYGIQLTLPVYELQSDQDRITELAEWGFQPKSYEPKCWMGCPMQGELTEEQRNDLAAYYDKEMLPQFNEIIIRLEKKKRCEINGFCSEHTYI